LLDAYLVYNKTFNKLVLMLQQDIHIKMGSYNYVNNTNDANLQPASEGGF
jgi:hypothetical protein